MTKRPCITVILGTFNGAEFVKEQLDTIYAQTLKPDHVLVSDDGSTDATRDIINGYVAEPRLLDGPRAGYAKNYWSLIKRIPEDTDYLAISDQDDHWLSHKLERAVGQLKDCAPSGPALYGSRSWVCDAALNKQRLSRSIRTETLGFRHALTQNFAGGNTFVLNKAAWKLAVAACPTNGPIHDWWLYMLISGAGGTVVHDDTPGLLYRQHGNNQIGANFRIASYFSRARDMVSGRYRDWNSTNLVALADAADVLSPEARQQLTRVIEGRDAALLQRLALAGSGGLYRQGWLGQTGLVASLAMRKF